MSPELSTNGVHFMGDFLGNGSLSRAARDVVDAVRSLDVPVETLNLALSPERHKGLGWLEEGDSVFCAPKSRLSIANCNADTLAYIARQLPTELFKDRLIVGVWYWETEMLPESHRAGFDFVDEVWVTSKFIADNVSKTSPVPVRYFPYLKQVAEPPDELQLPPFLKNNRFVYLFCFDYRSLVRRKNPEGSCEAFIRAFPKMTPDGPLCVIKSFSGQDQYPLEHLELRLRFRLRPDIVFIDEWFTPLERDSLMARADCYVSLHRAEGLGMTLLECMALGKPCIATAYSGNLDFMTGENSWLIPAALVPIGPGVWPFPPDHVWADPDLDKAAQAMKQVFTDHDEAQKRGALGRERVRTHHSVEVVGGRLVELMEQALRGPVRSKPVSNASALPDGEAAQLASPRARALDLIKQARKESEKLKKQLAAKWFDSKAVKAVGALTEVNRLQQKALSETLKEIGELKKRLKEHEQKSQPMLAIDPELLTKILSRFAEEAQSSRNKL